MFTIEQRDALRDRLRGALSAAVRELLYEGREANAPSADEVARRLAELR